MKLLLFLVLSFAFGGISATVYEDEDYMSYLYFNCRNDDREGRSSFPQSRTDIDPATGAAVPETPVMDVAQMKAMLQATVDSEEVVSYIVTEVERTLASQTELMARQGCTNVKIDVPPQEVKGMAETIQAVVQQNNYQLLEQVNTLFSFKLNSFYQEVETLLNTKLEDIQSANAINQQQPVVAKSEEKVPITDKKTIEEPVKKIVLPETKQEDSIATTADESTIEDKKVDSTKLVEKVEPAKVAAVDPVKSDVQAMVDDPVVADDNKMEEELSDSVDLEKQETENEAFSAAEPEPEPEVNYEPEPEPEPKPEPEAPKKPKRNPPLLAFRKPSAPVDQELEPEVKSESEPEPEPEQDPAPEAEPEPQDDKKPKREPLRKPPGLNGLSSDLRSRSPPRRIRPINPRAQPAEEEKPRLGNTRGGPAIGPSGDMDAAEEAEEEEVSLGTDPRRRRMEQMLAQRRKMANRLRDG